MTKRTVQDLDVAGKRVLVRVDFNVSLKDRIITDDSKIRAALPTLRYLIRHGGEVIVASHLGRPKGRGRGDPQDGSRGGAPLSSPAGRRAPATASGPRSRLRSPEWGAATWPCSRTSGSIAEGGERPRGSRRPSHSRTSTSTTRSARATARMRPSWACRPSSGGGRLPDAARDRDARGPSRASRTTFRSGDRGAKLSSKLGVLKNIVPLVDVLLIGGEWWLPRTAAGDTESGARESRRACSTTSASSRSRPRRAASACFCRRMWWSRRAWKEAP